MFSSGSWFQIAFGFVLGTIVTIFVIVVAGLLKRHSPIKKLASVLAIFALTVTLIFYVYVSAISGGILVEWHFLGFPAIGEPAIRVLDIGYVETKAGNIYHATCVDCQDKSWELVKEVPKSEEEEKSLDSSHCGALPFLPFQRSDFVDSKSICAPIMWGSTKISYAIDDDGHVYSWIYTHYPGDVVMPWYVENSLSIAIGIFSTIFGLAVISLLALSNFVVNKVRRDGVKNNLVK
jgi:hypothetical protein